MQVPIEQQLIDMMVPHHESAVAMAQLARERAEHAELRQLADAMIEHHKIAIEAGKIALNRSTRREVQALAQEMVAAQTREIGQMSEWRAAWSQP